jgi:hypothetical protein
MLLMSGCGPTARQRNDTAVSAYHREDEELDRLTPGESAARGRVYNTVFQEFVGKTPVGAAELKSFGDRFDTPDSPQRKHFDELLSEQPEHKSFVAQLKRTKLAWQAVEDAGKDL